MDDYEFERNYWGDCCNTFDEDQKHYIYARLIGLSESRYHFDAKGKSVLDIGGGPSSMLLKCRNLPHGVVVDPIQYPQWTVDRYRSKNIRVEVKKGEDFFGEFFDECWIYNCLQHCDDAEKVIGKAKFFTKKLRIFEWVNIPPHEGHPIMLTKPLLDSWIGQKGNVTELSSNGCYGMAYYGAFNL